MTAPFGDVTHYNHPLTRHRAESRVFNMSSNDKRYATVIVSAEDPVRIAPAVLDRKTGKVALYGQAHFSADLAREAARDANEGQSVAYMAWTEPDGVKVLGELAPAPDPTRFTARTWDCASGPVGEGDSITVDRVAGSWRRATVQCQMGDHDAVVVIDKDDAVDVANALLEAVGLDVRVGA